MIVLVTRRHGGEQEEGRAPASHPRVHRAKGERRAGDVAIHDPEGKR